MDIAALVMGLTFAFIWSSAFTSARIIVASAPPLAVSSVRFFLAGCVALVIARALGQSFRLTRNQWRATIIFGVCQNALYLGLNFIAMQWIEAGLASIIASTMPLIVALIGWMMLGDRLPWSGVAGLVLGFGGVLVIMGARLEAGVSLPGVALCIIGALALAVATLSLRGATSGGGNLWVVLGYQMLIGSACLVIPAALFETWTYTPSIGLTLAFLYTVFIPGITATWIWFLLVGRIGAVKAATFHFLNPFFGVLVAWIFLDEQIGVMDILGVAVIAVGILMVQLAKQNVPRI
ncbi:DMT family transporter [Vannielia sp.]|uniref:DMT family transporter n=1 Tax=Vannielia sp. TaxID=2813045 RepID=UPI002612DB85|nr:DMT family transporter [Vannielia sp.]MDF1874040.1 DMT family transporter [Vannielia sp.]